MSYQRGDIYYVERVPRVGSEQQSGRPAIIVSCDWLNKNSTVLEIVYLTTQKKPNLSTHVKIISSGVESTALCEQIYSISANRIGRYCGRCTEAELTALNDALNNSLGLADKSDVAQMKRELKKLKIQYATLRDLHMDLMSSKDN